MKLLLETTIVLLVALLSSLVLMQPLRRLAAVTGLVDRPNHRKVHAGAIPLVGGIAVAMAMLLALALVPRFWREAAIAVRLLAPAAVLLVVGILDDRFDVRAIYKLGIQLVCALALAASGVRITDLHGLFGVGELDVFLQYGLTVVLVAGVVNAINLIDGIDGLAGMQSLIGAAVLGTIALAIGEVELALLLAALVGAVSGFLRYNLSQRHKVFLGDAGALFIGMVLIATAVRLWQVLPAETARAQPVFLWAISAVFWVPVLDALRVFLYRRLEGKSPFAADRTHLHHLALRLASTHRGALALIAAMSLVLFGVCSLLTTQFTVTVGWLAGIVVYKLFTTVLRFHRSMGEWQERIQQQESARRSPVPMPESAILPQQSPRSEHDQVWGNADADFAGRMRK